MIESPSLELLASDKSNAADADWGDDARCYLYSIHKTEQDIANALIEMAVRKKLPITKLQQEQAVRDYEKLLSRWARHAGRPCSAKVSAKFLQIFNDIG